MVGLSPSSPGGQLPATRPALGLHPRWANTGRATGSRDLTPGPQSSWTWRVPQTRSVCGPRGLLLSESIPTTGPQVPVSKEHAIFSGQFQESSSRMSKEDIRPEYVLYNHFTLANVTRACPRRWSLF